MRRKYLMQFNPHFELKDKHAFLSASKYHWINYDLEKLKLSYNNFLAVQRGTDLHDFACAAIRLRQKLKGVKTTLAMYVNDAIGFRMTPEQPLYYSPNCFGTADAISYSERDSFLRIHDLKTGSIPAHMEQLEIYAALFCLEYGKDPHELSGIELRIYQSDNITVCNPDPDDIQAIMAKIKLFDRQIEAMKVENDL